MCPVAWRRAHRRCLERRHCCQIRRRLLANPVFGLRHQGEAIMPGHKPEERLVQSIEALVDEVLRGRI
jgi:hypothetical protein